MVTPCIISNGVAAIFRTEVYEIEKNAQHKVNSLENLIALLKSKANNWSDL